MSHLFDPDNPFLQFISKIFDLMLLNLIFIFSCIPVITVGASMSALSYVNLKIVRGEDPYIIKNFVKSFRQNFKQSTIVWLLSAAVFAFLFMDFYIINFQNSMLFSAVRVILWVITAVLFSMFLYVFPIISHFVCTTRQAIKNAALMAFGFFPYTVLLLALCVCIIFLCTASLQTLAFVVVASGLCGFSLVSLVSCLLFNRMFKRFEPDSGA